MSEIISVHCLVCEQGGFAFWLSKPRVTAVNAANANHGMGSSVEDAIDRFC